MNLEPVNPESPVWLAFSKATDCFLIPLPTITTEGAEMRPLATSPMPKGYLPVADFISYGAPVRTVVITTVGVSKDNHNGWQYHPVWTIPQSQ